MEVVPSVDARRDALPTLSCEFSACRVKLSLDAHLIAVLTDGYQEKGASTGCLEFCRAWNWGAVWRGHENMMCWQRFKS